MWSALFALAPTKYSHAHTDTCAYTVQRSILQSARNYHVHVIAANSQYVAAPHLMDPASIQLVLASTYIRCTRTHHFCCMLHTNTPAANRPAHVNDSKWINGWTLCAENTVKFIGLFKWEWRAALRRKLYGRMRMFAHSARLLFLCSMLRSFQFIIIPLFAAQFWHFLFGRDVCNAHCVPYNANIVLHITILNYAVSI